MACNHHRLRRFFNRKPLGFTAASAGYNAVSASNVDAELAQISLHYRIPPSDLARDYTYGEVLDMNELLIVRSENERRAAEAVR